MCCVPYVDVEARSSHTSIVILNPQDAELAFIQYFLMDGAVTFVDIRIGTLYFYWCTTTNANALQHRSHFNVIDDEIGPYQQYLFIQL